MKVYQEDLFHWICEKCSKPWSISDIHLTIGSQMYCPHCCELNTISEIISADTQPKVETPDLGVAQISSSAEPRQTPQPGQLYRHFKGGIYEIIEIAQHSETKESLVIYRGDLGIWARPLSNFLEVLEYKEAGDKEGTNCYRFQLIKAISR